MGSGHSSEQTKPPSMGSLREDRKIYKLVDIHGGGWLITFLRYAMKTGDHSILDGFIDTKIGAFLYNQEKAPGKLFSITELVKLRNKERNERLNAFSRKKGKGKSGPNVLDAYNQEGKNVGDVKKGSMGETIIGVCLLQSSDIHNRLALKILDSYPNLANDINVSEDYYVLTPLHQAIINQDPAMVFTLLMRGANFNTRCYGAFFCAEDQRSGRTDSLEHENVDLPTKTNYTGNMYYVEYTLSFAVCLDQPDCFRLLLAKKANLNAQDTNGNTVLHMCVIHKNKRMFKMALEKGANIKIINKQKLTPLTLVAKLGNQMMFNFILELEGSRVWAYGDASSVAYPLAQIDSVDEASGEINENSALSLAVYGETPEHLDFLDGLLDKVIDEKWKAFGRRRLFLSISTYLVHLVLVGIAFYQRPGSWTTQVLTEGWITRYGTPVEKDKGQVIGNLTYLNVTRNGHRASCSLSPNFLAVDNILAIITVLLTFVHCLFYCRAFKFVGPFVLMIYRIIHTDIRRFLLIYGIFLIGFAQEYNKEIQKGKVLFLLFETGVSILQFNLLIAMMTRTYEAIVKTKKEYKRQFARVILMLEVSLSHKDRRMYLLSYSRPIGTNKDARSLIVNKSKETRTFDVKNESTKNKDGHMEKRKTVLEQLLNEGNYCLRRPFTQTGRRSRPTTKSYHE